MRSASTDSLDAAAISAALGPRAREIEIDVVASCGSTNADLLAAPDSGVARLLAADYQSAGRGRHGRRWRSAPGTGICFSLRRRMRRPPRELAGASLAAGVAVARALRAAGARAVALKWPNDLLDAEGAKLGGILIETRLQGRSVVAVIGIGVNYRSNPDARVRRRTAALENLVRPLPSRNLLIAAMTRELLDVLDSFDASGLAPLREEWESLHAYAGQRVRLRLADGTIVAGIDAGVAEDGAMRVRTRDGVRALHSARVLSARPA
jgi:BirA family transcriptional regulator, biotin operon repressor / biotin---[acetyl-CoA-carboxylase] ligase